MPNIVSYIFRQYHFRLHLCVTTLTPELPDSIKIAINWKTEFLYHIKQNKVLTFSSYAFF